MSQKIMIIFSFILLVFGILYFGFKPHFGKKQKFLNVVLIGIAGSGKGTQGDLMAKEFNFYQISAGDALREHREKKGKYADIINQKIDKGELVSSEITSAIMFEKIENIMSGGKYKGIIYDGFPRNKENEISLNNFLKTKSMSVDLVLYINVTKEQVIERLSNRYSCKKCGEIYNKKTKNPKVLGVCDKCGSVHFSDRADDADFAAIQKRFDVFQENTRPVLIDYTKQKDVEVLEVDGNGSPAKIFEKIKDKIKTIIG